MILLAIHFLCSPLSFANENSIPQITVEDIRSNVSLSGNTIQGTKNSAPKTLSPYFHIQTEDINIDSFPLKHTDVEVDISGVIADINIRQVYRNNGKETIEAVYVFPMSTKAAVHAMQLTIGDRIIDAEIQKRADARLNYEKAKAEGKSASLLEQNRPNVFQMNVANILPGDEIVVEMQYSEVLQSESQVYEFVFPTVVGPRFSTIPKENAPNQEEWIESPYLQPNQPSPSSVSFDIEVEAPFPLQEVRSPSHELSFDVEDAYRFTSILENGRQNKDLILNYRLAGERISSGLMTYEGLLIVSKCLQFVDVRSTEFLEM